jgi:flagellar motor switch protein FliN/FliY
MTSMILDDTTTGALSSALIGYGMSLMPTEAGAAINSVVGPVLITQGSRAGVELPEAIIAIADRPGFDGDEVLLALSAALANSVSGLEISPAEAVADLGSVVNRFASIAETLVVMQGSEPVGVVLWIADRRSNTPPPSTTASASNQTVHATPSMTGLAMLRDVELEVSVELGRTQMTLADVLGLHIGSVVELDRPAGSPVDVRVNGTLLARGEVVVVDGEYAVRISEVVEPDSVR